LKMFSGTLSLSIKLFSKDIIYTFPVEVDRSHETISTSDSK